MTELMLKPGWPGSFRRTIATGKKPRVLVFNPNEPIEVSAAEMKLLENDIGISLFEVERDEKNRPRFVETAAQDSDHTGKSEMELEPSADAAHV